MRKDSRRSRKRLPLDQWGRELWVATFLGWRGDGKCLKRIGGPEGIRALDLFQEFLAALRDTRAGATRAARHGINHQDRASQRSAVIEAPSRQSPVRQCSRTTAVHVPRRT